MKKAFLPSLIIALTIPATHALMVTNTIDAFTVPQSLTVTNATATNSTSPSDSSIIGGYRTLILGSSGGSSSAGRAAFEVVPDDTTLVLATGSSANASFQVIWGGLGGTNGIGGFQFGGGQVLELSSSFLSFSLQTADRLSGFTWSFTDLSSVTATYVGSFPATASAIPYSISLDSFANANSIDWNAINLITFSGGNVTALDLTIDAPIQVVASTVPEPGTFVLLIAGLGAAGIYVRCRKNHPR